MGDLWGGTAAMLVALPSAIAFGVAIMAPLGGALGAQGAMAGMLGAIALGLVVPVLGGSTRLVTAPCAPAAAVLAALAAGFAHAGMPTAEVLWLLALIGLLAGVMQIALGWVGIGRLIRYVPFPVVSGYLSGVGLIIIGSQLPNLLGVDAGQGLLHALQQPAAWRWESVLIGSAVAAAMLLMPLLTEAIPAPILALLAGMLCYGALAWADPALRTVAHNPMLVGTLGSAGADLLGTLGMAWPSADFLNRETLVQVAMPALTLALLLSIDTLKTCVVIDAMSDSTHDSNRELIGQGVGNIASALLGGIPGAGTMGASLINISSGGSTKLSGFVAGVASLLALVLLAPLIAWVPVAALAAILIVTGFRMIDRHSLSFFYAPDTRLDFMVIVAVIVVALWGSLVAASSVGVALAILLFIREHSRVSVVRGRTEGAHVFTRRLHGPHAAGAEDADGYGAVVIELQGNLFFGTASQLHAALEPEVANHKYVILSMRRVQSLDVTATHVLEQIKNQLEKKDAFLVFCDIPKGLPSGLKMKRFLKETGVVQPTSKAFAFRQLAEALKWVQEREHPYCPVEFAPPASLEWKDMPVLAACAPDAVEALGQVLQLHSVAPGKKLIHHDRDPDSLYLVKSGSLGVELALHKKEHLRLAQVGPGDVFGSSGFFGDTHTVIEATALEVAEVYQLTRSQFDSLAQQYGALATALMAAVARSTSLQMGNAVAQRGEAQP
ncbi:MAG: SulP family inorganic anion transporter [Burkholderiales bacterium]